MRKTPRAKTIDEYLAGVAAKQRAALEAPRKTIRSFSRSTFRKELAGYPGTKSALHFLPDAPLPSTLVRKLMRARIAEG